MIYGKALIPMTLALVLVGSGGEPFHAGPSDEDTRVPCNLALSELRTQAEADIAEALSEADDATVYLLEDGWADPDARLLALKANEVLEARYLKRCLDQYGPDR